MYFFSECLIAAQTDRILCKHLVVFISDWTENAFMLSLAAKLVFWKE